MTHISTRNINSLEQLIEAAQAILDDVRAVSRNNAHPGEVLIPSLDLVLRSTKLTDGSLVYDVNMTEAA